MSGADTYDPADDSKRSYDVAVDALRAKFVEDVKRLRAEASKRLSDTIYRTIALGGPIDCDAIADATLDETLAWLSEAELPDAAFQVADDAKVDYEAGLRGIYQTEFRAMVGFLRREMKAVSGS